MSDQDDRLIADEHGERTLPLQQLVTFRVSRLHARLNAEASRILKAHGGLSLTQWRILVMLDAHGEQTSADIVRHTHIDKAQVSRAARDMVAEGLLVQRANPNDLRAMLMDFSDKGRHVFEQARPHMRARQSRITQALSHDEADLFFSVLDRIESLADTAEAAE